MLLLLTQGGNQVHSLSLSLSSSLASTFSEVFVAQQICRNLGLRVLFFCATRIFQNMRKPSICNSFFLSFLRLQSIMGREESPTTVFLS